MSRSPDEPMTRSALDRYFQLSLYLLIVTGFVMLASTGKLDAASLVLVSAALLYRGYLLARGRVFQLPEHWTSHLTIFYAGFYICDLLLLSGNFVSATVHLVLFAMVVKIFSVQRDRDYLYLAIISFLSVLAAAVLTVDAVFLASFCAFLVLACSTFISMEMRRSASTTQEQARDLKRAQRLPRLLSTTAIGLALGTAFGAVLIFFILPRLSTGYLSAYVPRNALGGGFSDQVRLGDIGRIQQLDSVVMHIQIEGDTGGTHDLKWRGLALRTFDGTTWSNPQQQATALTASDGTFDLSATRAAIAAAPLRPLRYRVLMEPIGASVFFLAPVPRMLSGSYRTVAVDESGAVLNNDPQHPIGAYKAISNVGEPSPDELRAAAGDVPPQIAIQYLQLPSLDTRTPSLAHDITAAASTPYDKAVAVEHYLQSRYNYTLQLPSHHQHDPLSYFLFDRKAGHCEYFASAMAIMLRTLGISARVVNGFRGGEFNPVTGSYIVRARDAHSWVEAYFPHYGWISFDPTPASATPAPSSWSRAGLYVDALREFWREWVINYDFSHQMNLSNSLVARSRGTFEETGLRLRHRYAMLIRYAKRLESRAESSPRLFGASALAAITGVFLLLNARRLYQAFCRQRLARNPARYPRSAAGIWYARMLRSLAHHGWRKLPNQTPKELVTSIADARLRASVAAFTEHYERARFGDSVDSAQALPELYRQLKRSWST